MKVSLPPSWRDFEAYRLVKVEHQSTREAAKTLRISQTRICQVIERVAAYLVQIAPAAMAEEQRPQMLYLAEQLAAERVNYLYGAAVESYRESSRPVKTVREVTTAVNRNVVTTTRSSCGDPRYLLVACRLAERAVGLPAPTLFNTLRAEAVDDSTLADEGVGTQQGSVAESAEHRHRPLDRDCSELFGEERTAASRAREHDRASAAADIGSEVESIVKLYSQTCELDPVQRMEFAERTGLCQLGAGIFAEEEDEEDEDDDDDDSQSSPVRDVRRPLNRKERRARQALLNRKLRKAK